MSDPVMATVCSDRKGVLLIKFLLDAIHPDIGRKYTVNGYRYFDTFIRLKQAITMKRPGMFSNGVLLIQNNACTNKHMNLFST